MSLFLRCLTFLACIPSGGALLLKVWGVTSMLAGGLLFLACLPIFPLVYHWARRHDSDLARAIRVGCWGGLVGTLGYDIVRIPFYLWGYRVFSPIQAYGVWLLDAERSSGWTDALGWLYHFSNGISFGLMYTLVMAGRHWGWGMLWGLALEAIVLSTPFAQIFHLQGNLPAIAIAYGAHLAYGFPLGLMAMRWEETDRQLCEMASTVKLGGAALLLAFVFSGVPGDRSHSSEPKSFRVQGYRLYPTWLRMPAPGTVELVNPDQEKVTVVQPSGRRELEIEAGQSAQWSFSEPGIYQCYVKSPGRSTSSFVIIEPVEKSER